MKQICLYNLCERASPNLRLHPVSGLPREYRCVNQHRIEDEQQSNKESIFRALDGTNDQMELELEFVRKKIKAKRKATPSPLLAWLAGEVPRESIVLSEEDSQSSMRGQRGFLSRDF
jgi:hypothetical protein